MNQLVYRFLIRFWCTPMLVSCYNWLLVNWLFLLFPLLRIHLRDPHSEFHFQPYLSPPVQNDVTDKFPLLPELFIHIHSERTLKETWTRTVGLTPSWFTLYLIFFLYSYFIINYKYAPALQCAFLSLYFSHSVAKMCYKVATSLCRHSDVLFKQLRFPGTQHSEWKLNYSPLSGGWI